MHIRNLHANYFAHPRDKLGHTIPVTCSHPAHTVCHGDNAAVHFFTYSHSTRHSHTVHTCYMTIAVPCI